MSRSISKNLRLGLVAVAAATIAIWTVPSMAFRMIQNTATGRVTAGALVACNDPGGFLHWTNSAITWFLNPADQGSEKAAALQSAMASWTNVANADHTLSYAGTTTAGWATDGVNTVLWANGNGCTGSCLALTALVLQGGQVIVESDITFNSNYIWNTNGEDYDTQATATHEFGHSLGIHHSELTSLPRPTMYASYFGLDGRTLETDDVAALQCAQATYPPGDPPGGGSAPPIPSVLNVTPEYCLGWATMAWAASSGATYYELQRAYSSTYSPAFLVYSAPGTEYAENGGTGTKFYRVRACNTSGCSGWRNGSRFVGYWNPCR